MAVATFLVIIGVFLLLSGSAYLIYSYLQYQKRIKQAPQKGLPTEKQMVAPPPTPEVSPTMTLEDQIKELKGVIRVYKTEELPFFEQRIKDARIELNIAREKTNRARYNQDGPPMPGSRLAVADSLLSRELKVLNDLIAKQDIRKQELAVLESRLLRLEEELATSVSTTIVTPP